MDIYEMEGGLREQYEINDLIREANRDIEQQVALMRELAAATEKRQTASVSANRSLAEMVGSYRDLSKAQQVANAEHAQYAKMVGSFAMQQRVQHRERLMWLEEYAAQTTLVETELNEARRELYAQTVLATTEKWFGAMTKVSDFTRSVTQSAVSNLGATIADGLVDGTYDWERAAKSVLKTFIRMTVQMTAMLAVAKVIGGVMGGGSVPLAGLLFHSGGYLPERRHRGGPAPRRYRSGEFLSRNEVPAILERGEFVVRKEAVRRPGVRTALENINQGAHLQGTTQGAVAAGDSFHFSITTLDTLEMERLVEERLIPLLKRSQRRGAYRV